MNQHSKQLGADCRKRAAAKWGPGWRMLSEEQQRGAIALEVVSVVLSLAKGDNEQVRHLQDVSQSALYPE